MEIHPITADHGILLGLGDDDHEQYLLADGTRDLAGAWDMGSQALTNVNVDGGTVDNVALGATCTQAEWDAAYAHISATGAQHSYIDQAVLTTSSPTFERVNLLDADADATVKMQTGVAVDFPIPVSPGSASEGTIVDNLNPWNNPTNIIAGAGFADCTVDEAISDDLRAYNFNFDTAEFYPVPADATITGIEVQISRKASQTSSVRDESIRLVNGDGNVVGDNKKSATYWPSTDTWATYGGAGDMWGTSLTAADIRDSDFGVDILIETYTSEELETGYVYWVRILVYFTRVTYFTAGIDETDLSYKISYNSVLGGTDRIVIDPDGNTKIGDGTNQAEISSSGDLTFVGSAGLAFGCLDGIDETVVCTVQNTWYQVTFDTAGPVNNVEADIVNNELQVTYEGIYQVGVTACFHSNPSADFELLVKKTDGTVDLAPHLFQTTAFANKVENTAGYCLIDINAGDRVELWVRCTSGTTSAVFDHISLIITQIGGT